MFDLLVANYNNEKFLNGFFDSIINSTALPHKIIFVDDCSTDNSLQIVRGFIGHDKLKIQLIRNSENQGFANSLNTAIANISSQYFARLDPDDFVADDRFEKQLEILRNDKHIDVLGSNCNYVMDGKIIKSSNVKSSSSALSNDIKNGLLPIIHGTIMGRSEVIVDFKYQQVLVPAEDYDLFAYFIFNNFKLSNLQDSLTFVNIHSSSVSNDLKFSTVMKRYNICESYFQVNKNIIQRYIEYKHQYYYRNYLFKSSFIKYFYLALASLLKPIKVINSIKVKINIK